MAASLPTFGLLLLLVRDAGSGEWAAPAAMERCPAVRPALPLSPPALREGRAAPARGPARGDRVPPAPGMRVVVRGGETRRGCAGGSRGPRCRQRRAGGYAGARRAGWPR